MDITVLHYYSYRIVLIDIALRTSPLSHRRRAVIVRSCAVSSYA